MGWIWRFLLTFIGLLLAGLFARLGLGEKERSGAWSFWSLLYISVSLSAVLLVATSWLHAWRRRWTVGALSRLVLAIAVARLRRLPPSRTRSKTRRFITSVVPVFLPWLALLGTTAVGVAVITDLALIAQLGLSGLQAQRLEEQNEKLDRQNQLITDQNTYSAINNRIAAIQRLSESQQQEAERRYDEIIRILEDSKSEAAQIYALEQLPEAMVIRVEMVDPEWDPEPYELLPALAKNLRLTSDTLCRLDTNRMQDLDPLLQTWNLNVYSIKQLRWAYRFEAHKQLYPVLGNRIDNLLICEELGPARFTEDDGTGRADLAGVYMDGETYDKLCSNLRTSLPAFAEILPSPNKDSEAIENRRKWHFPGVPKPEQADMDQPPIEIGGD